jgi:hypothetical protein
MVETDDPELIAAREAALTGYSGAYEFLSKMFKKGLPEERDAFSKRVVKELKEAKASVEV